MKHLQFPDIDLDMQIIANGRLRFIKEAGLVAKDKKEFPIPRFCCPERGYVFSDMNLVMMFMSDLMDIRACIASIQRAKPPIEVWILDNDKITTFRDLSGYFENG